MSKSNIVFQLDVFLGDNIIVPFNIYEGDDVDNAVKCFCDEYDLNGNAAEVLKENILSKINNNNNNGNNSDCGSGSGSVTYGIPNINLIEEENDTSLSTSISNLKSSRNNKHMINNYYYYNTTTNFKPKRSRTPDYPGERLYREGIDRIKKKEKHLKQLREEEETKDILQETFTPYISTRSRILAGERHEPIENKLIRLGNKSKERKMKLSALNAECQRYLYNFKPNITTTTNIKGAKKRKKRIEQLPTKIIRINPNYLENASLYNTEDTSHYNTSLSTDNKTTKIFHRDIPIPKLDPTKKLHDFLYIESKLLSHKKEKLKEQINKQIYTFKPDVAVTANKFPHKKETESEFINRLHGGNKAKERSSPCSRNEKKELNNSGLLCKTTTTTDVKDERHKVMFNETLLSKMKKRKYKQLFTILDNNKDGLISSKKIGIAFLDITLLESLIPLLTELQVKESEITFKEFCKKIDKIPNLKLFTEDDFLKCIEDT